MQRGSRPGGKKVTEARTSRTAARPHAAILFWPNARHHKEAIVFGLYHNDASGIRIVYIVADQIKRSGLHRIDFDLLLVVDVEAVLFGEKRDKMVECSIQRIQAGVDKSVAWATTQQEDRSRIAACRLTG